VGEVNQFREWGKEPRDKVPLETHRGELREGTTGENRYIEPHTDEGKGFPKVTPR